MKHGRIRNMRGEGESTSLPEVDPTALVIVEKRMIITEIDRNKEDIPGEIDPHNTTKISRISTEIILESGEVLPTTEATSQGRNRGSDQETNTDRMAMSVTIGRLLLTEVETRESPPHTAQVEGIKATATTSLTDTEENQVALVTDTTMMAGITDRDLVPEGECLRDRGEESPESHQQGEDRLSSVNDLHLVEVEMRISSVGDVVEKATRLTDVKCFRTGEGNHAIVVCFTEDETVTVPLEPFSRRW